MNNFKYYFSTKQKIDNTLNQDVKQDNISQIIFYVILEAYYEKNIKEQDEIIQYVDEWMKTRKVKFYYLSVYSHQISRAIKAVKKMPWRNITSSIPIRKSELDHITSFNEIKAEKLLFCYLAIAKFCDMSRQNKTHWENESDTQIFKMARIHIPASERDFFIYDVISDEAKSKVHQSFKDDDTSKRIDFVSDDENDPVIFYLDENNYKELAFTYLNWKNGGGYKPCKSCGKLFKTKKNLKAQEYCGDCEPKSKYKPKGDKMLQCIDCGEDFVVAAKNNRSCRCEECQREYIRQYDRIRKSIK